MQSIGPAVELNILDENYQEESENEPASFTDTSDEENAQPNFDDFHDSMFELMLLNHRRGHKSSLFDWIPFIGILNDLKMRILLYPSDFYHGVRPKSLFSIAFMFFCSIAPALAFGVQLEQKIGGNIGLTEVLSSTALCGMIFAVIGGQPLVIVGVTGPVVIFTTTVYNLAEKFKIPFLEWYCVIGFIAPGSEEH
jgi:hypothetical protein